MTDLISSSDDEINPKTKEIIEIPSSDDESEVEIDEVDKYDGDNEMEDATLCQKKVQKLKRS